MPSVPVILSFLPLNLSFFRWTFIFQLCKSASSQFVFCFSHCFLEALKTLSALLDTVLVTSMLCLGKKMHPKSFIWISKQFWSNYKGLFQLHLSVYIAHIVYFIPKGTCHFWNVPHISVVPFLGWLPYKLSRYESDLLKGLLRRMEVL